MKQTSHLQKAIYKDELTDAHNVLDWLMSQKTVVPRLNKLILPTSDGKSGRDRYIDFTSAPKTSQDQNDYLNFSPSDLLYAFQSKVQYLVNDDKCKPITLWLAGNFETFESRDLLLSALNHIKSNR